jgi:carbonic anhydrase
MRSKNSLSRREFVALSGSMAGLALAGGEPAVRAADAAPKADDILKKLMDGNARFVAGKDTAATAQRSPERREQLAEGQNPFAVIVSCADSRVAPELLFDQGLGDLFIVRVAGNVVSGAGAVVKGSIEYAVAVLGSPFIMVLGHSKCGAVKAALKYIDGGEAAPGAIGELVKVIKPAAASVKDKPGDRLENATNANVLEGVRTLKSLDPILAPAVKDGKLKIVGATYDLKTGKVVLLDGK